MFAAFLSPEDIQQLQLAEAQSDKAQKKTPEQIEAIHSWGQNILVSASAGSGKTFVMVQRIMEQLKRGVGIKNLFISTFTVKAAGELKERLETELSKAMQEADSDDLRRHLAQQLADVQNADIGTMDAFTQKLLTEHGYLLGISPQFRILTDKSEQDILKKEVFTDLFRDYLTGPDGKTFERLVRNFTGNRKDSRAFQAVVNTIYDFIQSTSNPQDWLRETFLLSYQAGIALPFTPEEKIADFRQSLRQAAQVLEDVTNLEEYGKAKKDGKPTATYLKHQAMINQLDQAEQGLYEQVDLASLSQLAGQLYESLPSSDEVTVKGTKYPVFKDLKSQMASVVHLETILKYQGQALPLLEVLQRFMLDFTQQYLERKKAENALEFADVSHLAIQLLETEDQVRQSLQAKYHEVMVDEYQDTNHTQERILELLSNGHNRFMVGDIKQSIYRFRQADPQIFNQKFKLYQEDPNQGKLILLKENFRSQIEVLEATNALFSRLMDEAVGDVTYDDSHSLVAGSPRQLEREEKHLAEYLIYDTDQGESIPASEEGDMDQPALTNGEVELVAKEIIRLHQEEGVAFKDITLLVASRTRNDNILKIFDQRGIPLVADGGESNYLKSIEVMVMLDTLRSINNPLNDYALIALLKSPMFAFDEDELARISLQGLPDKPKQNFYDKLVQADQGQGQEPGLVTASLAEKISRFRQYFEGWRSFAQTHSIYDLIWKIYQDRLYYDHVGAMVKGDQRQANLYALALRANRFEQTGFKGLPRFISMIDKILQAENDLADVELVLPKDAVSLMTIHKSKGLQFPYVFILNMDKKFDGRDEKSKVILSRQKGIGIKYLADMKEDLGPQYQLPTALVSMDTFPYQTNQEDLHLAALSEQMRLLYVAMTRAEKKLYLVGKASQTKSEDKYGTDTEHGRLPVALRKELSSFQDWFLAIEAAFPEIAKTIHKQFVTDADLTEEAIGKLEPALPFDASDQTDNRQSEQIRRALEVMASVDQLNQTYRKAIDLPTLRTPSQVKAVYRPVIDGDNLDVMDKSLILQEEIHFELPDFAKKKAVTALELGSATHELMQRLVVSDLVTLADLETALSALNVESDVKDKLDLLKLYAFFSTDLGILIQEQADKLHREAPFAMIEKDPESDEDFVIRGIIDGYLLLDDRIVLFDYKTDRYSNPQQLIDRYQGQMNLYAEALRKSYQIQQVDKYLILLGGETLQVVQVP
ncbi:helicase-exonuclease AddAB subunit AddA [Streptococcus caprae]|uniref:ATP-dependent helicase/nuclease subunit A n=1 Tax=Streptococcus caprae TaxID=1640501 RepID=A0ABV8CYU9_9STRE